MIFTNCFIFTWRMSFILVWNRFISSNWYLRNRFFRSNWYLRNRFFRSNWYLRNRFFRSNWYLRNRNRPVNYSSNILSLEAEITLVKVPALVVLNTTKKLKYSPAYNGAFKVQDKSLFLDHKL